MTDPLVTVYITNYNYARYIEQAIGSVLAQTFQDFELIIIDDGSTDASHDIIARYEGRPKIRVVLQANKGLNATNHVAVGMARGRYVMRLDADDYLDDNALLVMTSLMEREPSVGLVFPDWYYVDAAGKVTGQERRLDFQKDVKLLDQPAHGACTMIRRDCLIEVNAYSDAFRCQDGYDLWLKIIDRYPVRNVNLPLFYYRRHGENLTNNQDLILETRSHILDAHAKRSQRPELATVAVIPVAGPGADPLCLSLAPLGDKPLLYWTIEAALATEGLGEVIVSSPDRNLLARVGTDYANGVTTHERAPSTGRAPVPYDAAVLDAVAHRKGKPHTAPDAIMVLTHDAPFRSSFYIGKAINVMRIFDVDAVFGVMPETDIFFQHDGAGLKPLGNNAMLGKMRFEREYLYRHTGGTSLLRRAFYEANATNVLSGRIGHFVLSRQAGMLVRTPFDLKLAEAVRADINNVQG